MRGLSRGSTGGEASCGSEGPTASGRLPEEEGGFLLGKVARLSARRFAALLREAGLGDLEQGQGRILFLLWRGEPLSQGELARRAGLDKSSLALLLERLEGKGLVRRDRDPRDARRLLVSASDSARASFEVYEAVSLRMTGIFYEGLSAGEIAEFERLLGLIAANLSEG